MNTRILLRISCLVVAILGSVPSVGFVAAKAYAETPFTLPDELVHEGLTFSTPLHFTKTTNLVETKHITFTSEETEEEVITTEEVSEPELFVKDTKKEIVFAEEIVLPTPKKPTRNDSQRDSGGEQPTPTKKITPTPLPSKASEPTMTPTPTQAAPTPTAQPAASVASLPAYATNGTLSADTLFSMVNQKRTEAGLPPFEKQGEVCTIAESRKPEIENEVYGNSSIHAGFRARDLPFRASENMISQNTEAEALTWWMNSSIHRAGILGNSKYACIACQNKTCSMIMSSLDPK